MNIHNSYKGMKKEYKNLVVALGNFDGVHQGHRSLLNCLVETAQQINGTPAVLTFDPHPLQVVKPGVLPPLLLTKEDKFEMISRLGVKVLFCIPFTKEFSAMSPEKFISDVMVGELGIWGLKVGFNYNFGKGAQGNPEMLALYAQKYNFDMQVIPPVIIDNKTVSSTLIRGLILDGNIQEASYYLGYKPFIKGKVVHGEQRGRKLGFPTANLDLPTELFVPQTGVYAVLIKCNGQTCKGVANIGFKPTFQAEKPQKNLEVHILNFNEDIYGETIEVHFAKRIRSEVKFNSVEQLVKQIELDKNDTINFFLQE